MVASGLFQSSLTARLYRVKALVGCHTCLPYTASCSSCMRSLYPLTTGSIHAMVLADIWRFHRVKKFSVVSVLLVLVITLVIIGGGP
jgi:hypothetical protein